MVDLNEVFGPTVQGEGPLIGSRCMFVRLSRCDLSCDWCDTPYTWDWDRYDPAEEIHSTSVADILGMLDRLDLDRTAGVVISGGEPMLQRKAIVEIATEVLRVRPWVQIETNGRHAPPEGLPRETMIVASPKLTNSGMSPEKAIRPEAIAALRDWGAAFKFVAESDACLDEVSALTARFDLEDVWVMPQGTTNAVLKQHMTRIADEAIRRGFNITPRLHVDMWGQKRAT